MNLNFDLKNNTRVNAILDEISSIVNFSKKCY